MYVRTWALAASTGLVALEGLVADSHAAVGRAAVPPVDAHELPLHHEAI